VRAALAAALAVLLLGSVAEARRLRCPGAFAKSCVRVLYRGFVAKGACTRDFGALASAGAVTDCWANGARATITGFGSGSGLSELVSKQGRTVRTGETVVAGGTVTITYRRGRRTWSLVRALDGGFTVTCPDGAVETYTAAEVAAGGCGPIAECPTGTCP
jgi:hypothetical protein